MKRRIINIMTTTTMSQRSMSTSTTPLQRQPFLSAKSVHDRSSLSPNSVRQIRRRRKLVIVEGNISAGKSILCAKLGEMLNYKVFIEPALDNPYLERFYADPKKWALTMQIYLLKIRFQAYISSLKLLYSTSGEETFDGVLLDRSIFSDVVFAEQNFADGNISHDGMEYYWRVRNHMMQNLPYPDLCVYLDVSPEVCLHRINAVRQRQCESSIPVQYLKGLDYHYQSLLSKLSENSTNVVRVDWNNFGDTQNIQDIVSSELADLPLRKSSDMSFLFDEKIMSERLVLPDCPNCNLHFD